MFFRKNGKNNTIFLKSNLKIEDLVPDIDFIRPIKCRLNWDIIEDYKICNVVRVKILSNPESGEVVYCIDEPELSDEKIYRIAEYIAFNNNGEIKDPVEKYYAGKIASGIGPVYPVYNDSFIEEIAFNGGVDALTVYHREASFGWIKTNIILDEVKAGRIARALARRAGKPLSLAYPMIEGVLPEGHRVAISLGREVSRKGTSFVIRMLAKKPISLPQLVKSGTLSPLMASYLWLLAEMQAFIMIIGGMASGKTTLMQAILNMLPENHRVVTIEDTPELNLVIENWDPLVTRPVYVRGSEAWEISLLELSKFALRRRAEHLVIGEVRGEEARVLAQAAATGHGSMCLHWSQNIILAEDSRVTRNSIYKVNVLKALLTSTRPNVLSMTLRVRKLCTSRFSKTLVSIRKIWVTLETECGRKIVVTTDHPIPASKRGGFWKLYKAGFLEPDEHYLITIDADSYNETRVERIVGKKLFIKEDVAIDVETKPIHYFFAGDGILIHNCTFHADTVRSALFRLMSEPISLKPGFTGLIWAFVLMRVVSPGVRRVIRIVETVPRGPNKVSLIRVFTWEPKSDSFVPDNPKDLLAKSYRLRQLAKAAALDLDAIMEDLSIRSEFISSLAKKNADAIETREYLKGFYRVRRGLFKL